MLQVCFYSVTDFLLYKVNGMPESILASQHPGQMASLSRTILMGFSTCDLMFFFSVGEDSKDPSD